MMNEGKLKSIISIFLKIPPEKISGNTQINNSVIKGSVLFHRMISRVNDAFSIEIEDYSQIDNYNDLIRLIEQDSKDTK